MAVYFFADDHFGNHPGKNIFEHLPEKLLQAAVAREENPEASLTELAAMMDPPITKPAMNHRLKKLVALSKEAVQ